MTITHIKIVSIVCCLLLADVGNAQDTALPQNTIKTRFYLDSYLSYDVSSSNARQKAAFLYNHNRLKAVNINLALADISYSGKSTRAAVGLMAGTYAKFNLAAEPTLLQHVFEANVGIKLSPNKNLWLDAGIMPSHIGFESAISKDCWTLTRSILAENSPYYETGIKASYTTADAKWYAAVLLLNGWQRTSPLFKNNIPAWGTQLTYTPSANFKLNWSSYVGVEKPNAIRQTRLFNNFYGIWQFNKYWGLIVGFDVGFQQNKPASATEQVWLSPVAMMRYEKGNTAIAARVEYYGDKAGTIVSLRNAQPFQMQGYSINIDRKLGKYFAWRVEWRLLHHSTPYFEQGNSLRKSNHTFTTALLIDVVR
jgi:hypothetical protein